MSAFNFYNNLNVTMVGGIVWMSVTVTNPHYDVYQCYMTLPNDYNITGTANISNTNGNEMSANEMTNIILT